MYYDKDGKPLELMEWAELHNDYSYTRIEITELPRGYVVSTVWLGLDHNYFDFGSRKIFETAILKDGRFLDVFDRCDTLDNAKRMHQAGIQGVRQLEKENGKAKYLKRMNRRKRTR